MGRIMTALANFFGGGTPQPRVGSVHAASDPFAKEDAGWQRVGADSRDKSLSGLDHQRMVTDSVRSFQRDALARRWVRMKTSFVVGDCPRAVSEHEDDNTRETVQAALDEFQDDEVNDLSARIPKYVRNLYSTGGLCLLLAGADVPGSTKTRVGRVDQEDIDRAITDPDNADVRIGILRCSTGVTQARVVHPVVGPGGKIHEMFDGLPLGTEVELPLGRGLNQTSVRATVGLPCMYLGINDLSGQHLGISDLFPALDSLQDFDDVATSGVQRGLAAMAYAHVRKVPKGTSQQDIDKIADDVAYSTSRQAAAVLVHTDDQEHEILNPTLASGDVKALSEIPLQVACIASGFPPHWFAQPGDTNLATASETTSPVVAMLVEDQSLVRTFFEKLIRYALMRVPAVRMLANSDPMALEFSLSFPALKGKDEVRASTVFQQDLAALSQLRTDGVLTTAAFQREAARLANEYGFEIEEDDIPDPDEIDAKREAYRSAFQGLGQDDDEEEDGEAEIDDEGAEGADRRAA